MNIDEPKVDVIVPVYKVESYLKKCIDSLLNQTYDNYIVTLVDDGSPDKCPLICDEYAVKYPQKVRVYHKPNGGLSDARNYAVERSKSEFVAFVDSDDWVSNDFILNLMNGLTSIDVDLVISPFYRVVETSKGISVLTMPKTDSCEMTAEEALIGLCKEKYYGSHACSKLIRRSLVLSYPYPVGKYYEDSYTTYKHIVNSRKISYVSKPGYYYLQRNGSIVRSKFQKKHLDFFYATREMVDYMISNHYSETIIAFGVYKLLSSAHTTFVHAKDESDFDEIYRTIIDILNQYKKYFIYIRCTLKSFIIRRLMISNRTIYHFVLKCKYNQILYTDLFKKL